MKKIESNERIVKLVHQIIWQNGTILKMNEQLLEILAAPRAVYEINPEILRSAIKQINKE